DAQLPSLTLGHRPTLTVATTAPDHDIHAEAGGAANHLLADAADTEKCEGAAVQPLRVRELLLVPSTSTQFGHVIRHTSIERQNQRKGKLRHGDGILPRAV